MKNGPSIAGHLAGQGTRARPFGAGEFSEDQVQKAQALLARRLGKQDLSTRSGPGGIRLTYIESHKAIELANEIFDFNGWSCAIVSMTEDYIEQDSQKRWSCGVCAIVQVSLKDGTSHEDVGYGSSENMKSKGLALEKARKEAVSDGRKRALRLFGNGLGNCLCNFFTVSNFFTMSIVFSFTLFLIR